MGKKKRSNAFSAFAPIRGVKSFAIAKAAPGPPHPVASHQKYAVSHAKNVHWGPPNAPIQLAKLPPHLR